jgi:uncharacterized membrane protein YgdD (TMEM256/DUF423 family)
MNDARFSLIAGSLLGLTGVIAGALGAHSLENRLTESLLNAYETATRFQMFHALLLLLLGILARGQNSRLMRYAIRAILLGTVLFSGSIYLLTLSPWKPGLVTPVGGLFLIAGWCFLLLWAWKSTDLR